MDKRINRYSLTLALLQPANELSETPQPLALQVENHDELFNVIERAKQKNLFGNEQDTTEFTLGLKLFTEVMIRNRNTPLFEELMPAIGKYMQKLKAL